MSKKSVRNMALGTALAAAAGYVTGILTAPKSGKETRKELQAAATKARHEAEAQLKKLHSELSDLLSAGQDKLKTVQKAGQKELHKALAQAETAREKARELLSALHEGDSQDKDLQKAINEVKKATAHLKSYLEKKDSK